MKQFVLFLLFYLLEALVITDSSLARNFSYIENKKHDERCNFSFWTNISTLGLQGHGGNAKDTVFVRVNASNCEFETVTKDVCNLCSIERNITLDMTWNRISMLGELECNCPGIKETDFSYNKLTMLRANSFIFAKNMIRIYMCGNDISEIEENVFNKMKRIEEIDLSKNVLRGINLNIFNNLSYLRKLNLSANKLQRIVSWAFTELESLEELDLSYNNIHYLDSESFEGIEGLRFLNLAENNLANPDLSFLSVFYNLSLVNLGRNKFVGFEKGSLNDFDIHEIILNDLPSLRYILDGAFRNGSRLKKIDLSRNNKFIFIEDFAFQNMQNDITFDISYTTLKSFPIFVNNSTIIATGTPLRCECTSTANICSYNESLHNDGDLTHSCEPTIVSHIEKHYFLYVGQRLKLDCFVVGQPKPRVTWERIFSFANGTVSGIDQLIESYFLNLLIPSLNTRGTYRCTAESNGIVVYKYFNISVKQIDIGIQVLSRNSHSILVGWNKTLHTQRHVLLYRAFESTSDYVIQKLNDYLRIFIVRGLQPFTEYEICIASLSDVNDKSCVRAMTSSPEKTSVGIRHNNLAVAFLVISGVVFGAFVFTTVYRCLHKVRIISKQSIFIVGSESRECFADVTESTFTYENHQTEPLIDTT